VILFLSLIVFVPMLVEARRAAANERRQIARGGIEPAGDVYSWMRVAYPGAFVAMIADGALRSARPPGALVALGLAIFAVGKMVKWTAVAALGPAWTFRVIVVPGDSRVTAGPYRFLKHPNYLGVVMELIGVAVAAGAAIAGPLATVGFGVLILRRIRVEEAALRKP
jgi:methyltransferase